MYSDSFRTTRDDRNCFSEPSGQIRLNDVRDTAPSLRLPATHANRGLLRLLRAAEMAAWQEALNAGQLNSAMSIPPNGRAESLWEPLR